MPISKELLYSTFVFQVMQMKCMHPCILHIACTLWLHFIITCDFDFIFEFIKQYFELATRAGMCINNISTTLQEIACI